MPGSVATGGFVLISEELPEDVALARLWVNLAKVRLAVAAITGLGSVFQRVDMRLEGSY